MIERQPDPTCRTCKVKDKTPDRFPCLGCICAPGAGRWEDAAENTKPASRGDDMQSPRCPDELEVQG